MGEACSMYGGYKTLVVMPEGERSLGRLGPRWDDIKEIRLDVVDWIHLARAKAPVVGFCGHRNEPSGFMKDEEFLHYRCHYQLLKKASAPWSEFSYIKYFLA